eukprot:EG_transcript_1368
MLQMLWLLLWPLRWFLREKCPDLWWAATVPFVGLPTKAQRQATLAAVLESDGVRAAVTEEARRTKKPVAQVKRRAQQHLHTLAADHGPITLRVVAYLFKKLIPYLYAFGIHFSPQQISRVQAAAMQGASFVYIPNHKSHMDYLVLTYLCALAGLPLPHVVAGDNLNFALVGTILKRCGAVFIRRQFGDDPLYHAVFRAYMRTLLVHGHAVECFIESQRSRTGKVLLPKTGFLRCVTDACLDRVVQDAIIVPISLGYDRVLENQHYAAEMMGARKNPEALCSFLAVLGEYIRNAWQNQLCYGRIDVGIAEPLSVNNYIEHCRQYFRPGPRWKWTDWDADTLLGTPQAQPRPKRDSTIQVTCASHNGPPRPRPLEALGRRSPGVPSSTFLPLMDAALPNGAGAPSEDCLAPALDRALSHSNLRSFIAVRLAFRCLWDCNQVSIVPPGVLVATVLATEPIRGIAEADLQRQVEAIREEVEVRGGLVAPMEHGMSEAIERVVVKVLGMEKQNHQLVKRHKNFIMLSLWTPPEQLELSMMRNQLIHLFLLEGFVCVSMYAAEKSVFPCFVRREALRQSCIFLMHLFKREFIYKPSHYGDPFAFDPVIDFMVDRRILTKQGDELTVNDCPSTAAGENQGPTTYLFLCGLLWPFIESYWLAAVCLRRVLGGKLITLQTFVRHIQVVGERLFFESHIDLFEAISASTLQNALLLFVDWGVLERVEVMGGAPLSKSDKSLLRLTESFDNEAALDGLTDKIVKFRKKCRAYRSRRYQQRMRADMECGSGIVRTLSLSDLPVDC